MVSSGFSLTDDVESRFRVLGLVRNLVGAIGFEPTTSRSRTERSTRLSHAPFQQAMILTGRKPIVNAESLSPVVYIAARIINSGEKFLPFVVLL